MIPDDIESLEIVEYPDPILKLVCAPVETFDEGLKRLGEHMLRLMREAEGVGLAAPQVGLTIRMFVCNHTGEPDDALVCINPSFTELDGAAVAGEGCLSLPGVTVNMRRPTRATIEACDVDGKPFRIEGTDLRARIWLHEADHLDGKMIVDRMSEADQIANRRSLKQLRDDFARRTRPMRA